MSVIKYAERPIRPTKVLLSEEIASIVGVNQQHVPRLVVGPMQVDIIIVTTLVKSVTAVRQRHALLALINKHVHPQTTKHVFIVHRVNTKTKPIRPLVKHVWEPCQPIEHRVIYSATKVNMRLMMFVKHVQQGNL